MFAAHSPSTDSMSHLQMRHGIGSLLHARRAGGRITPINQAGIAQERSMNFKRLSGWMLRGISILSVCWSCVLAKAAGALKPETIVVGGESSSMERLAAREVRRYYYARTGRLLPILRLDDAAAVPEAAVLVGRRDRRWLVELLGNAEWKARATKLGPGAYWLKTVRERPMAWVVGGDDSGTLYGAYRLAEQLGVRFYLHGDVIPDSRAPDWLPELDEERWPLFALRGIQPFHDFPEGPDWWNLDDYRAVIGQLPKLGMNFFGLHTYPEKGPNAEPTVWIGLPEDVGGDGRVQFSYGASYQNTLRGNWGYQAKRTSDFSFGAAELFDRDDYGGEVMRDLAPEPSSLEGRNEVFNRAGELLGESFRWARMLGVRTCVGTETPLVVPEDVRGRVAKTGTPESNAESIAGGDSVDRETIARLYDGIYTRAARAYAPDYYWFWTPETWTWDGTKEEQVQKTLEDLAVAIEVHGRNRPGFELAMCGWVLGPERDRTMFDKVLPREIALSCINREVGRMPVDRGFGDVTRSGKWAIPWLEDDPALTSPQLWAGRMRRDAADALRYGCNGLMGIHWRTRVVSPAVGALASAAWDQSGWAASEGSDEAGLPGMGALGGKTAQFADHAIDGTDEDPLYQSLRYGMDGYRLALPRGSYRVTLKFCEPHHEAAGKRVFDVRIQGTPWIEGLDIFERVGGNRALEMSCDDVAVTTGLLEIEFVPRAEMPSIAAILVESGGLARKINCGGGAYQDYEADTEADGAAGGAPPISDFYEDWARHEFGDSAGESAAAIFTRMDGRLPRASDWVEGPGGIRPDPRSWDDVKEEYQFVDELEALRPRVQGDGAQARFDYWLNTFQYARAMGKVNCTWAQYTNAMSRVRAGEDALARRAVALEEALPLRRQLVREVREVYRHLLATVSNPGELGTVANWEQHLLPGLLEKPGRDLEEYLGAELPEDARPGKVYVGPKRLVVPTVRTALEAGESLRLKVIIAGEPSPREAVLRWRWLGERRYRSQPLQRVARAVYEVELPGEELRGGDFEYHVRVVPLRGRALYFPATAPGRNQTVVLAD
jgi:hypothetical protein